MKAKISLYDQIGGYSTLEQVHKLFYDKIYAHPWLGAFFKEHKQEFIERRQSDFMAEKMGSSKIYMGKQPLIAHRAMYITEELFEIRQKLLLDTLQEFGLPAELIHKWMRIDAAFKKQIVKKSIADFYSISWKYKKRIIINRPKTNE